jgi:hypothetical protein
MTDKNITVKFTYNGANQAPTWEFDPDPQVVPKNTNATIKWNLEAKDSAGHDIDASFADTQGVYFLATDEPPWPGETPTQVNATKWKAQDNNRDTTTHDYNYGVKVSYSGTIFTKDPKIENRGG